MQPVNVYWLARQMLSCRRYTLKDVYRHLFGLEDHELHRAEIDAIILVDIVRMLAAYE